jgi:hypothetical protein
MDDQMERYATIGAAIRLKELSNEKAELDAFLAGLDGFTPMLPDEVAAHGGSGIWEKMLPSRDIKPLLQLRDIPQAETLKRYVDALTASEKRASPARNGRGHRHWTAAQRQQKSQAMKQVWAAKRNAVLRAQLAKSSPKRRHAA